MNACLDASKETECLIVKAVHVASVQFNIHLAVQQLLPQCWQGVPWSVEVAPAMGEAEDDVVGRIFVDMGKQLLDAEPEDDSQSCIVGLEEDTDAVDLLDVGDMTEDAVKVLLVLLHTPGVANARGVNDVDKLIPKDKGVSCWVLSCRLAILKVFIVSWFSNEDILALSGVCCEGELGRDG